METFITICKAVYTKNISKDEAMKRDKVYRDLHFRATRAIIREIIEMNQ